MHKIPYIIIYTPLTVYVWDGTEGAYRLVRAANKSPAGVSLEVLDGLVDALRLEAEVVDIRNRARPDRTGVGRDDTEHVNLGGLYQASSTRGVRC